jgi:hypothetical protein
MHCDWNQLTDAVAGDENIKARIAELALKDCK